MDTQAPPNTGARLTPQAVEALIARRLDALGHSPDLLDHGAVAALVADAAGSGRRLRSSLAATLFLASTEDAPEIDADLVHRALMPAPTVMNQPGPAAQAAASRPGRFKASRLYLVAGVAALAVALTGLVLHEPSGQPAVAPTQSPAPLDSALSAASPGQELPARSATGKSTAVQPPDIARVPAPPPILAPLPPPVAVRSLPVPASSVPEPVSSQPAAPPAGLPPLPAAAPASIIMLYPARDAGALDRLRPIALKLQNAGMTDIRAKPVHAPPPRRVISYFYSEDRPLADAIAKSLAGSTWPKLTGNALQPSLVLPPPGLPGRIPGTIEVQLP